MGLGSSDLVAPPYRGLSKGPGLDLCERLYTTEFWEENEPEYFSHKAM